MKNVLDSDGTVIFTHGELTGGSLLTRKKAIEHGKPVIHLNMAMLDIEEGVKKLQQFIVDDSIEVLNVAGSRASEDDEIYEVVLELLEISIKNDSTGHATSLK